MAEYVIQGETLTEIADAIRTKRPQKSEYTQLEYIESSGTQYIDTGYFITSEKLKIVARFMLTELKAWAAIWGVEGTEDETLALTPLLNGSNNLTFYSGGSSGRGAIPVTAGVVYDLACQTVDGAISYECNGVTGTATAEGTLCKTDSFYVFTLNSAKDSDVLGQASKMRLYSFQMYDNDVLVRDLVPCRRADGTLGLYDLTAKTFYTNAGTGAFTAGADVGAIEAEPVLIPTTSMAAEILAIEGGGSTGGATVQRETGRISTNGMGYCAVNCGFIPDCVVFDVGNLTETLRAHAAVVFSETEETTLGCLVPPPGADFKYGYLSVYRRPAGGFTVNLRLVTLSGTNEHWINKSFDFVAIKYT